MSGLRSNKPLGMEVRKEEQDPRDCTHTHRQELHEPSLPKSPHSLSRAKPDQGGRMLQTDLKAWPAMRCVIEEIREKTHPHMPGENDGPRRSNIARRKKIVGYYAIWDKLIEARGTAAAMQMALSPSWLPNRTTQDSLFPLIFLGNDRLQQAI